MRTLLEEIVDANNDWQERGIWVDAYTYSLLRKDPSFVPRGDYSQDGIKPKRKEEVGYIQATRFFLFKK